MYRGVGPDLRAAVDDLVERPSLQSEPRRAARPRQAAPGRALSLERAGRGGEGILGDPGDSQPPLLEHRVAVLQFFAGRQSPAEEAPGPPAALNDCQQQNSALLPATRVFAGI